MPSLSSCCALKSFPGAAPAPGELRGRWMCALHGDSKKKTNQYADGVEAFCIILGQGASWPMAKGLSPCPVWSGEFFPVPQIEPEAQPRPGGSGQKRGPHLGTAPHWRDLWPGGLQQLCSRCPQVPQVPAKIFNVKEESEQGKEFSLPGLQPRRAEWGSRGPTMQPSACGPKTWRPPEKADHGNTSHGVGHTGGRTES